MQKDCVECLQKCAASFGLQYSKDIYIEHMANEIEYFKTHIVELIDD